MTEQQLLAPDRQQVATCQLELDAERQQLAVERMELAAERADLAAERIRIDAEWKRLAAERDQGMAEQSSAAEDTLPAEESEPSESPGAAVTDDDIFARLRALSVLREDAPSHEQDSQPAEDEAGVVGVIDVTDPMAEEEEAESPVIEQVEAELPVTEVQPEPQAQFVAAAQPVAGHGHPEGEESIDDYMARLFARLNGGRSDRAQAESAPRQTNPPVTESTSAATSSNESADLREEVSAPPIVETPVEEPDCQPLTMMPRRAPERQMNLSAMRELANMSASSAIGASQRRRWTSSGAVKLGAAAALGIFGIAVLLFASSGLAGNARHIVFGFGAVLFIAGALWLLQGSSLLLMAWRGHGAAKVTPEAENVGATEE